MNEHPKMLRLIKPILLGLIFLTISFAGLYNHELWTPDEPREAAITLEMSRTKDYLVPKLAGKPFVEKPPLFYILGAVSLPSDVSPAGAVRILRTHSAVWGLLTLAATFMLARRLFGTKHALFAFVVLATLPGFVNVTHRIMIDNALMFFVTASIWFFVEFYLVGRSAFILGASTLLACGFLTKGIIAPVLVFPAWICLFVTWLIQRDRESMLPGVLLHLVALIIFILLCGEWVFAFYKYAGPELWNEWFWSNHFGRFLGQAKQLGHQNGPFYYIPNIAVSLLPWLVPAIIGIIVALISVKKRDRNLRAVLPVLFWSLGGVLLLSLSATKREIYL
ncbi:MAG: phospholipid carrier-dependent glycosyltransferase, partial [Lentisphaerae bacterium]|nr:phospholipid carrier-dependent glycosyltransferase [Lentisphaerota bacterium]